jgi:hypothetical protein
MTCFKVIFLFNNTMNYRTMCTFIVIILEPLSVESFLHCLGLGQILIYVCPVEEASLGSFCAESQTQHLLSAFLSSLQLKTKIIRALQRYGNNVLSSRMAPKPAALEEYLSKSRS